MTSNVEWSDVTRSEDPNGATNLVISTNEGEASSSTRLNLGLRKDLLTEPTYLDIIVNENDDDLFKNKPIFVEVEATDGDMLEQQEDRGPSYVNLTTLPTMIHDKKAIEIMANMSSNNNGMPSIATLFNSSWASSSSAHEDGNIHHNHFISPCHFQRSSMEMMSMQDFSNSSYIPTDDAFKSAMPLGPNPLYHLDTNNRRIWVPESSRERDSASGSSRATAVSLPDTGIYMVADLESEDILNQHVVNIERFPNRCWRGPGSERSSSSRTQYEKGMILLT